jgi:hypothetical protein
MLSDAIVLAIGIDAEPVQPLIRLMREAVYVPGALTDIVCV